MSEYEWRFKIGDVEFSAFSIQCNDRAKLAQKVVWTGVQVAYISKSGKFHSSHVNNGSGYTRMWRTHLGIMRQARALGVLDKKAAAMLIAEEERRNRNRGRAYAARDVLNNYKEVGITLTPAQLILLRRLERDI